MAGDKQQKPPLLTTWRGYPVAKLALKELTSGPKKSGPPRTRISWKTDDKMAFRGFLARHSHSPASKSKTDRWSCKGCTDARLQTLAQKGLGLDTTRITPAQWAGVRDRMLTHFQYEMSRWVDDGKITHNVDGETGVETFVWDEAVRKSWVAFADALLKEPGKEQPQEVGQDEDEDVDMDEYEDQDPPPQPPPAPGQHQPRIDRQQPRIEREEDAHRRAQQQQQSHSARRGRPLLDTGTNWRLDNFVTTTNTTATQDGSTFGARGDNNNNDNNNNYYYNGPFRDDELIHQPSLFHHFPPSSTVAQWSGALQPVAFPPLGAHGSGTMGLTLDAHGLGAIGLETSSAPEPDRHADPGDSIANPVATWGRMATQPHVNRQQSRTNGKEEAGQHAQHQQHPPQDDGSFRARGQDNLDNLVASRGRLSTQPLVNRQQSHVSREEVAEQQVQQVQRQQCPPKDHATFSPRGDNEHGDDDPGDSIDNLVATRGRLVALAVAERRLRFAVMVGSGGSGGSGGLANVVREKHKVWAQMKRQGPGVFRAGGVFDMLLGLRDGAARGKVDGGG